MVNPTTSVPLDDRSFGRLRDKIGSISAARAGVSREPGHALPLPEEVGFQLTNSCNLRCKSCFQWNETGFHRHMSTKSLSDDLDFDIIERVLAATRPVKSKVFLWGGEPLIYSQFDGLMKLLTDDPRWTILSTNGIGLDSKIDSILPASENLACVVSLDGFEEDNDRIRGRNTFRRVMESVDLLLRLQREGRFRGAVTISCVISPLNFRRLVEFAEFFERMRVDSVYFVFPWYIPTASAERMDAFFTERFDWLLENNPELIADRKASWHSYQFNFDPDQVEALKEELRRLSSRKWDIRIRLQPPLADDEIVDFIDGSEKPAQGRTRCLSVATRMNVMPDGRVTTCKLFPEFATGTLKDHTFEDAWSGDNPTRTRAAISCGLMPICAKCVQLYLVGD